MPKGVDHQTNEAGLKLIKEVQKSLMPKGVDHSWGVIYSTSGHFTVQKSLMPKGVDHIKTRDKQVLDAVCKNL